MQIRIFTHKFNKNMVLILASAFFSIRLMICLSIILLLEFFGIQQKMKYSHGNIYICLALCTDSNGELGIHLLQNKIFQII
jgi:CRISPR/Cas system CMR-associated protein Cmr1 (group 7 of RAMP superfamily)